LHTQQSSSDADDSSDSSDSNDAEDDDEMEDDGNSNDADAAATHSTTHTVFVPGHGGLAVQVHTLPHTATHTAEPGLDASSNSANADLEALD